MFGSNSKFSLAVLISTCTCIIVYNCRSTTGVVLKNYSIDTVLYMIHNILRTRTCHFHYVLSIGAGAVFAIMADNFQSSYVTNA